MGMGRLAFVGRLTVPAALVGVLLWTSGSPASSSELEFELGFHNPVDDTELSWLPQPGATGYQLARSTWRDLSADCTTFETTECHQADATEPGAAGGLYYLVRELTPELGSWGADSQGFTRPVSCLAATGSLVGSSGCHGRGRTFGATETRSTQDCIEYEYLGEGDLLIDHLNTAFNCCPELEAAVEVEGDSILVTEVEISGICFCLCLFDLSYEIVNLAPAVYEVTVIQEYLDATDEPLHFTMDLLSSPSGIHCVERDHYPW